MRSRGPDMKGIWLSDDRKIGLLIEDFQLLIYQIEVINLCEII